MDRFGDTNLAHGVVVKVGKGWRGSGGRSGRPSTNHSSSDKTRLNDLSYGIKIWTNLSSVLLQYWPLTDGQTDIFLIARPRWHSMQQNDMRETEEKKKEGWPPWLCDLYNLTVWPQQVATTTNNTITTTAITTATTTTNIITTMHHRTGGVLKAGEESPVRNHHHHHHHYYCHFCFHSPWRPKWMFLLRPTLVGKALSFTHELSFPFFINPPRSAATQWMAIKCISEVRS